ncbi:MAG: hypothetical protein WCT31_00815 [Candidatus Micrarchaeia archaeon]|jgi:hypothetical protein
METKDEIPELEKASTPDDKDGGAICQELGKAWRSTTKVLFGVEMDKLSGYENYLKRYTDPMENRKSAITGKDVTISSNRIPTNAKVIAHDEADYYAKMTASVPFNINEIKDIDSIVAATREKVFYTGNVLLGNSIGSKACHRCVNLSYSYGCQDVRDGKYVAFTTSIRNPEYSFGCCFGGDIKFCIKILDPYNVTRSVELFHANVVGDSYYCGTIEDSDNCMFSFNQKNKHYLIGNIQLPRDKYATLKAKLVAEMADELKSKKKLPSIIDIIRGED